MNFNINGTHYWVEESGQGEPVLLLHGFTGSSNTWSEVLPFLDLDFRVIRIDLPGHGKTFAFNRLDMESFCSDLAILLDRLSVEKVHLIGYSFGGRTALSFANYFPSRVASLILESTSPGLEDERQRQERKQTDEKLAEKIRVDGVETFVEYWEKLPLFSSQRKLPEEKRKAIRQERLSQQAEGLANSLEEMGTGVQPSWWEHLERMEFPILLVVGREDRKFADINKRMAERMPQNELKIISGAGHAVHVEQTEIFGTIVHGFLREQIEK